MQQVQHAVFRKNVIVRRLAFSLTLVASMWASPKAWALTVNPTTMTFQAVQGASNPPLQTLTVSKSNKRQSTWTAIDSAAWLTVSPGLGAITNTTQITVAVNINGLAAGTYTATITVTVDKAGSASFPVTLTVAPATTSSSSTLTQSSAGTNMASLTWSPVSSTNLSGYKLYMGTASGRYGSPLDVGNVTNYVMSNLAVGNTYYFVVTSYNSSGSESLPSSEVSKSIY